MEARSLPAGAPRVNRARLPRPAVRWEWVARGLLIALPLVMAVIVLSLNGAGPSYGFDFRGGTWAAAHAILAGRSPYPTTDAHALLRELNAYIPPPLFALIALPLTVLPWAAAIACWNLLCVLAFLGALRLVEVRDWRLYPLAICAFPVISSIGFGQVEGLMALALAAAWRWRDSPRGAAAVGALIAAKLVLWPLAIWLLLTRGARRAGVALAAAGGLLLASWACIGFHGLAAYPKLLAADADAFRARTQSLTSALMRAGLAAVPAELLAIGAAALLAVAIVRRARARDEGLFLAAVTFALLASPLMEMHYLTLLLIPLAIARPRLDALWLLAINVFWLSPQEPPKTEWQVVLVVASVCVISLCALDRRFGAVRARAH